MSDRHSFSRTRWFALPGRELAVLVLGVGLVLAFVAAARAVDHVWGRGDLTVSGTGDATPLPARMNVKTSPAHELALLPGIGAQTADRIVRYRKEHGPFRSFEDLLGVKGIGPRTLERIRPHAMCAPLPGDPQPPED